MGSATASADGTLALMGTIFTAIGAVAILAAILVVVLANKPKRGWLRTQGVIVAHSSAGYSRVSMDEMSTGNAKYSHVEYTTATGERVEGRSRVASSPPAGKVGATATVYYNPHDPYKVSVRTGRTAVMSGCAAAIALVIGIGFLMFGLGFLGLS